MAEDKLTEKGLKKDIGFDKKTGATPSDSKSTSFNRPRISNSGEYSGAGVGQKTKVSSPSAKKESKGLFGFGGKKDKSADDKKVSAKTGITVGLIGVGALVALYFLYIYFWWLAIAVAVIAAVVIAVKYPTARWWIISGLLIALVGYFVYFWAGVIGGAIWLIALRVKVPQSKWIFRIGIVVLLVFGAIQLMGTGRGKTIASEIAFFAENDLTAMQALGMTKMEYFWNCKIVSIEGCEIAELKGDTGGIYLTRLEARPAEVEENIQPVFIEGTLSGKSWASKLGDEGPDIRDLKVDVSTEWTDEVLAAKYPDNWRCTPNPIGANEDFVCKHIKVDLREFKNTKTTVCGAPFKKLAEREVGRLACAVQSTTVYDYSTEGFRLFKFSNDQDSVSWDGLTEKDVWWSANAPVVLTLDQRAWNKAHEPWDSYEYGSGPDEVIDFVIEVVVSNNIPTDIFDVYGGLKIEDMSAKIGKLTLELPARSGINVNCGGGGKKSYQEEKFVYCEYDFKGEEIVGADQTEHIISLLFEDYDPGILDDYTVKGTIDYTASVSRTAKVKVKYRAEEQIELDDQWEQTG